MDDERQRLAAVWPLFGLVVRTPRVELRYPTDADALAMAALTDDVHDPDFMPFTVPWTRKPDGVRERETLQHVWLGRATLTAANWTFGLVLVVDGEVTGYQSLAATHFAARRTVETGSWVHRPRQGQGLGKEMRAAVLHLAFAGLGAQRAETEAYEGNAASAGVTASLGYCPNGEFVDQLGGEPRALQAFVLDRETWEARRRDDIELEGVDACRELLGA